VRSAAVALLFAALTIVYTWPLSSDPAQLYVNNRETMVHVWMLSTLRQNLVARPTRLFDGNIHYPYKRSAAVADYVIADAAVGATVLAPVDRPLLLYNLLFLSTFALSGFCTYLLVRGLTGSVAAGLVSGIAFGFLPYRISHQSHLHVLSTQWLPIAFLALHRLVERPTAGRFAFMTIAGLAVALSSWHVALIGGIGLTISAACLLVGGNRLDAQRVALIAVSGLVSLVVLVPIALIYRSVVTGWRPRVLALGWSTAAAEPHAIAVQGFLSQANLNAPYHFLFPLVDGEARAFPGIAIAALALGAAFVLRKQRRIPPAPEILRIALLVTAMLGAVAIVGTWMEIPAIVQMLRPISPFALLSIAALALMAWRVYRCRDGKSTELHIVTYAALVLAGLILGLGPRVFAYGYDIGAGLFQPRYFPLFSVIRAPGRFSLLIGFGCAVLAGFTVAALQKRLSHPIKTVAAMLLMTAVFVDVWWFRAINTDDAPPQLAVYEWLRTHPEPGAVVEFPTKENRSAVYGSLRHGRRIVNGLGVTRPRQMEALKNRTQDLTPAQVLALLRDMHPRFVVLRSNLYDEELRDVILRRVSDQTDLLRPVIRFGPDMVYELLDRERDTVVMRRWPTEALLEAKGFQIEGQLAPGRPGTIGRVHGWFNGREVFTVEGAEAEGGFSRFVALEPLPLVKTGVNEIRLSSDYRYERTPERTIGTTGVTLCADVAVVSQRTESTIRINGMTMEGNKGYRLVWLEADTGKVVDVGSFNTSWFDDDSRRLAEFVNRIPAGAPVIVAAEFDVARRLTSQAVTALHQLGLTADLRGKEGVAHAAIGVKGAAPGTALETVDPRRARVSLGQPDSRDIQLKRFELQ
jgi:hypothetical protein